VSTLGQAKSDNNKRMITLTEETLSGMIDCNIVQYSLKNWLYKLTDDIKNDNIK
jgi:hypothetical protein